MIRRAVLAALAGLALAGCKDETVTGYGAAGKTWRLESIGAEPFDAEAVLSFPEPGRMTGEAPCNSFSAAQTAPYPWIAFGPIAVTRRACPDLEAEQAFLAALGSMSQAEILGDTLILRDEAGREMVFRAR